jgi:hypothetical protein
MVPVVLRGMGYTPPMNSPIGSGVVIAAAMLSARRST